MPCVMPPPPWWPPRARPGGTSCPAPLYPPSPTAPTRATWPCRQLADWSSAPGAWPPPSGRPRGPWGTSRPLSVSQVLQAARRCLIMAQPPVHLPSSGHTPDRASLKIASHRPASTEPPSDPEITALAARGGELLCDYVLRGRSKKALA